MKSPVRALVAILPFLVLGSARAATIELPVEVTIRSPAFTAPLEVRLTARAVRGDAAAVLTVMEVGAGARGRATLTLDSSKDWFVSGEASGFWCETKSLSPGGAVPVHLELWPTGRVLAKVIMADKGERPPQSLAARFRPSTSSGGPPAGETTCPVVDFNVECSFPSGTLDFDLFSRGYVARYFWAKPVDSSVPLHLPDVLLRRGASLIGYVTLPPGKDRAMEKCLVTVIPASAAASHDARASRLSVRAIPNARGFFQIEGIAPGRWQVTAHHEGLAPTRREVNILDDREAELREPLSLTIPSTLNVSLTPALDSDGHPWVLQLLEARGRSAAPLGEWQAARDGTFVRSGLASSSTYVLVVKTGKGARWWTESLSLEPGENPRSISLSGQGVEGRVRFGDRPLMATLDFGGHHGAVKVTMESDADGAFRGILPRLGKWRVSVTSMMPSIDREIEAEAVPRPGSSEAFVEIRIPETTTLTGLVFDEEKRPVRHAIINVFDAADRAEQRDTTEGGGFRIDGLVAGPITLRASAPEGDSDLTRVEIDEGAGEVFLELIVKARRAAEGRLIGMDGVGIPGAVVQLGDMSLPAMFEEGVTSDAEGRFSLRVPGSASEVGLAVIVPGFSARLTRVRIGTSTDIPVDPVSGGLVLEGATDGTAMLRLASSGSYVPLWSLESRGLLERRSAQTFVVGRLAPGSYSLCTPTWDACVPAQVVAGQMTTVSLPKAGAAKK